MADSVNKRSTRRKNTNTAATSQSLEPSSSQQNEPANKRPKRGKLTITAGTSKSIEQSNSHQIEPSVRTLLCLNDKCLQTLFEHLGIENLCQMANVCKRFRAIAEQVFREHYKQKFVFKGYSCKNSVFRRVLCKFGHLMKTIDASDAHFDGNEGVDVNAIVKYCLNNLEKLILQGTTINCDVIKPLVSRLKYLDLSMCKFTGNKNDMFTNCPKLEVFGFEADFSYPDPLDLNIDRSIDFVVKKFPKLECLAFDCSYIGFAVFFSLLKLNPQVKQLDITALPEDMYIEAVVNFAKNVECLSIRPGQMASLPEISTKNGFLQLRKLKKLRNLHLVAGDEIYGVLVGPLMDAFAKEKVPINQLELFDFLIGSKDIKNILKLKTIEILCLSNIEQASDADLVPLTDQLPSLKNLQLYFGQKVKITLNGLTKMIKDGKQLDYLAMVGVQNLKIDKRAFENLLKVVQSRDIDKKLEIYIAGNKKTTSFNVPENIQRAGDKNLKIEYSAQ